MPRAEDVERLTRVVFLLHYGRSGTFFLQSLLDGHPSVLMFPGMYLYRWLDFWSLYGNLPTARVFDRFLNVFPYVCDAALPGRLPAFPRFFGEFSGFTTLGEKRDQRLTVDKGRFTANFQSIAGGRETLSRRTFFQALHFAYAESIGAAVDGGPLLILFHLHDTGEQAVSQLLQDFPDSLFLHMVRNPPQALGSSLAYAARARALNTDALLQYFQTVMERCVPIQEVYRCRSRALRLEDLHLKPRETLSRLVEWLGISWCDQLLYSTFHGLRWWNTQNSDAAAHGFQNRSISRTHEEVFASWDLDRLNHLTRRQRAAWGYAAPELADPPKDILDSPFRAVNLLQPWDRVLCNPDRRLRSYLHGVMEREPYARDPLPLLEPETPVTSAWGSPVPARMPSAEPPRPAIRPRVEAALPAWARNRIASNPALCLSLAKWFGAS